MKNLLIIAFLFVCISGEAQNNTDVSLFLKSDSSAYLTSISSESGNLYKELGHHGPAIENEWLGIRLFFDKKAAIDIYNKITPGLVLKKNRWYSTVDQQKEGWGADYYKVGNTIGLGGIRLWDGEKIIWLNPVTERVARVKREGTSSSMEMYSRGIQYKGKTVDILVRITVYSGIREAKVESFALSDQDVQFVTGINYYEGNKLTIRDNSVVVWGIHPEDVAAEKLAIGAAIMFHQDLFSKKLDDENQYLLISKPTKYLELWITSTCEKDKTINTLNRFSEYVENISY